MIILFLGAPGVGKGTFASIITQKMKPTWKTFSLGDAMRQKVSEFSPLGLKIAKMMSRGELVNDEVVNELCFRSLDAMLADDERDGENCIILDGYPRSLSQSEALLQHCKQKAEAVKILAVDIRLDEEVAIQKLLGRRICETCNQGFNMSDITGGSYDMPAILPNPKVCVLGRDKCFPLLVERNDDTLVTIKRRLAVHAEETEPVISYFRDRDMHFRFDVKKGVKDTPELLAQIMKHLGRKEDKDALF